MGITYSREQRESIMKHSIGKVIESLSFDEEDNYWVVSFTDGSEFCFRFMAELV